MAEVHALVATAKRKLLNCRLVLGGGLRRRNVSWRRTGALSDTFDWVANGLGLTFVDPNRTGISWEIDCIWMEEEKNDLNNYMLELADLMSEDQQGERSDKFWKM